MFGGSNRKRKEESLSAAIAPENAPSGGKGANSVTGFDPEGLERAAKAARDLDNSKNAFAAIELVKTQEATKQVRFLDYSQRKRRFFDFVLTMV
jgi:ATPase family AAA domain-containing protein 3A/B